MPTISSTDCTAPAREYVDEEINILNGLEAERQLNTIELVASENYAHPAVLRALSSPFQNKYSEGCIGNRYYGGIEVVDRLETLCVTRANLVYGLDESQWLTIVQTLSGKFASLSIAGNWHKQKICVSCPLVSLVQG